MGEYVDARSLTDEARQALQVRAARTGCGCSDAAEAFGVHRNVIGWWMRRYDEGGWQGPAEGARVGGPGGG